jgi:hypothetical protein
MNRPRPARRPLLAPGGGRRSLSNVGGPASTHGEPALAKRLAHALSIRPGEHDATLTHVFHAYPARMHPEVARRLVAIDPHASVILDPFCGSGTVLVEALTAGARAIGTDLSPLAVELSRLKTRRTTNGERKSMVSAAHAVAKDAQRAARGDLSAACPRFEGDWFLPHTLREVLALITCIDALEPGFVRDALRMLFSSILVKVSFQASDSDPSMRRKNVPPDATWPLFTRKAFELAHALADLSRACPPETPEPSVSLDDATTLVSVPDGSVHAVITSPPYAANYDYVAHHARRYAWLGLDASALDAHEIGAARWFADSLEAGVARFDDELTRTLSAIARVLAPGVRPRAYLLLADGAAHRTPLPADEAVARAAERVGLRVLARASQARPAFGPEAALAFSERPRREHLIALGR